MPRHAKSQVDKRRGQDSNLRTSYPVTDLANPRFRPLSHLSRIHEESVRRSPRREPPPDIPKDTTHTPSDKARRAIPACECKSPR